MARAFKARGNPEPGFYFFRIVWVNPTNIADTLAALRRKRPDLNFEVLDPHSFFALFKEFRQRRAHSYLSPAVSAALRHASVSTCLSLRSVG